MARVASEDSQQRLAQYVDLSRLLNHPDLEDLTASVREQSAELKASTTKLYIRLSFYSLIFFIGIWKLLYAVAH